MNKVVFQTALDKTKNALNNPHTGEMLFFLGYIIYLGKFVWDSTMFPFPDSINRICLWISVLLIGLKIILFDHYELPTLFGVAGMVICSMLVFLSTRYTNAVFWVFFVMGAKDLDMRKMLKVYLVVTGSIVFLAFCASTIGIIENLQYFDLKRGIRNSFGIIYVTDFAAYMFYLSLIYVYLKGPKLRWIHVAAVILLSGIVYYFCKARVDCICMVLTAVVFGTQLFLKDKKYSCQRFLRGWNGFWNRFGCFSMFIIAALSIAITYCYSPDNVALKTMNTTFNGRLELGKQGFDKYGASLFGKIIEMNGMGGSTITPENYFFIDCSYVNILLRHGIVFLLILLLVYTINCYKNRTDKYFLFAVALIAVNCIIAHHIIEVSYNPFAYTLLMYNPPHGKSINFMSDKC